MGDIYIKNLTVMKNNVDVIRIDFCKGMNLILGKSDIGKTCALNSIDYVFGAKSIPFASENDYTDIKIVMGNEHYDISFIRSLGVNKNHVSVISENEEIASGKYRVTSKKWDETIGRIYLKLIGINKSIDIPKNENFGTQKLSWRTLKCLWYVDEEKIQDKRSVFYFSNRLQDTAVLSSLQVMINDDDFNWIQKVKPDKVKKERKAAVVDYIKYNKDKLEQEKEEIVEQLKKCQGVDLDESLKYISEELEVIINESVEAEEIIRNAVKEIIGIDDEILKETLKVRKCKELLSQYISDLKRMDFIIEGSETLKQVHVITECPICHQKTNIDINDNIREIAQAEYNQILANVNSVKSVMEKSKTKITNFNERKEDINVKKINVEKVLENKLQPKKNNLIDKKNDLIKYIELKKQLEIYNELKHLLDTNMDDIPTEKDTIKDLYKPKERYNGMFENNINKIINEFFTQLYFEKYEQALFDIEDFDIVVNGRKKEEFGKCQRLLRTVY